MKQITEIDDPRLVKGLARPLRVRIRWTRAAEIERESAGRRAGNGHDGPAVGAGMVLMLFEAAGSANAAMQQSGIAEKHKSR